MPSESVIEETNTQLNAELQQEELLALSRQSIFTQSFIYRYHKSVEGSNIPSGTLYVNIELPSDTVTVHIGSDRMKLHYLPPIALEFTMPSTYPLQQNCEVTAKCVWLNQYQIEALEKKLDSIWQDEKNVILFHFADFLQNEILDYLSITFPLELENAILSGATLQTILQQHEKSSLQEIFSHTSFVCGICMEEKKGESCTQLDKCGHVFCKVCLAGYFSMLIREGLISQVRCPDLECSQKKDGGNDPPSREQLILITGDDLANRYDRLLLQHQHQLDPQITFCPRLQCQEPVRKDPNYEKLCYCTACGYAFCLLCQKTWHGPQVYCQFKNTPKIIKEYLDSEDDPEKVAHLEAKYGKRNLDRLITDHKTEMATEKWKRENTVPCPSCHIPVEKTFGCNHMTCQICQTHFCFLCGSWIDKHQPYKHFNSQGTLCHMRLFEGVGDVDIFDDFLPPI